MFKKTAITTVLALASLSASADWYVQPKVGYESRDYEISFGEGFDPATATIPGLVVGISLINSSGWYADFEVSTGDDEVNNFYLEDDYIERDDFTLSTGWSLGNGLTLFTGFTGSDTTIENQKDQSTADYNEVKFRSEGFFGGLAKTFSFNKSHSLSVSAAIGMMEGSYQLNDARDGSGNIDVEGDSTGYSANVAYSYRPGNSLTFTVGVKGQAYTYTDMQDLNTGAFYVDTEETLTNVFAKTSYTF